MQVTWLLNNLIKKDMSFVWGSTQQQAFDVLKEKFTMAPILAYPNNDHKLHLECNSSDFATGAVLSILKEDKWHLVAYASHSMSPEEHNYPITDKEMLSVIHSLEMEYHYLEGAKQEFEVWNDHLNLQWFMKQQDLNQHEAYWAQYLSRFNFLWLHKLGASMAKANALSQ